jgi:pseudouridine-5'-phosphate glycosidase
LGEALRPHRGGDREVDRPRVIGDALAVSFARVSQEVAAALAGNRGVVALESAVLTHGLPRVPHRGAPPGADPAWDARAPVNLEVVRAMQRAVRAAGAVAAPIGLLGGEWRIGLEDADLIRLAQDSAAAKAAARDIAAVLSNRASAGTTVSGTLAACALTHEPPPRDEAGPLTPSGIRVLATGGIGGVHREWSRGLDISGDLHAMAHTPVCIVCSGCKSVLDVPATLEALEALGVPVVGWRTDVFPQFYSRGEPGLRAPHRVDSMAQVAALCRAHWCGVRQESAVVVANPVPEDVAIPHESLEKIVTTSVREAEQLGIRGGPVTPFLLARIVEQTAGAALEANLALLLANARLAGEIAVALAARAGPG